MAANPELLRMLGEEIERCWAWMEHWGLEPHRTPLEDHDLVGLLDTKDEVRTRVKVLAENWRTWW